MSYCDNKDAVKLSQPTINPWYSPNATMKPNWDAYAQAHEVQKEVGTYFKINPCEHVKAHQDRDTEFEKLDWPAKLNCWADEQATRALNEYPENEVQNWEPFPVCAAYLEVNGKICMSRSMQILEDWVNEQPLHDYYKEHHGWSSDTMHSVDWDAFGGARNQFKCGDLAFTTKMCCGWLPTYWKLHQRKERTTETCITCG